MENRIKVALLYEKIGLCGSYTFCFADNKILGLQFDSIISLVQIESVSTGKLQRNFSGACMCITLKRNNHEL